MIKIRIDSKYKEAFDWDRIQVASDASAAWTDRSVSGNDATKSPTRYIGVW